MHRHCGKAAVHDLCARAWLGSNRNRDHGGTKMHYTGCTCSTYAYEVTTQAVRCPFGIR